MSWPQAPWPCALWPGISRTTEETRTQPGSMYLIYLCSIWAPEFCSLIGLHDFVDAGISHGIHGIDIYANIGDILMVNIIIYMNIYIHIYPYISIYIHIYPYIVYMDPSWGMLIIQNVMGWTLRIPWVQWVLNGTMGFHGQVTKKRILASAFKEESTKDGMVLKSGSSSLPTWQILETGEIGAWGGWTYQEFKGGITYNDYNRPK